MKKLVSFIVAAMILCLSACAPSSVPTQGLGKKYEEVVNTLDGLTIEVVEGTLTSKSICVLVTNETGFGLVTGNPYHMSVQKEVKGEWYPLEWPANMGVTDEGYLYETGTSHEEVFDWSTRHGTLKAGHYRVVKSFSVNEATEYEPHYAAAEFVIE